MRRAEETMMAILKKRRLVSGLLALLAVGCVPQAPHDETTAVNAAIGAAAAPADYYGTLEPFASHAVYFVVTDRFVNGDPSRSEEHTSELQSLMRISYAVFCLKKKKTTQYQYTAI